MEEPEAGVVADVLGREALLLEVGDELADRLGVHHGAREHVFAHARSLLEHEDRGGLDGLVSLDLVVGLDPLHQVQRGGQGGRAGADVEDVDLHALAFDGLTHAGGPPLGTGALRAGT